MAALPVPAGSSIVSNAGGRFGASSSFIPRGKRYFGFTAEVDMGNLMSLGPRWEAVLHERLTHRMGEAAGIIVDRAKSKLVPGHGYDTGAMHDSLVHILVHGMERNIVAYDLEADPYDTYYWVFVEFGHMTRAGNWWPGYHFLSSTLMENEVLIQAKVRIALAESVVVLTQQSRVSGLIPGRV